MFYKTPMPDKWDILNMETLIYKITIPVPTQLFVYSILHLKLVGIENF
jgi:hypothetical protein